MEFIGREIQKRTNKCLKYIFLLLFSGCFFASLRWSFAQELPIGIYNAPDHGMVSCLTFSPDGKLVTATDKGKVYVWNTEEKMVSTKFATNESDMLIKVVVNKDATLLAAAGKNKVVYVWNLHTGALKYHFNGHLETIFSLAFSPDGNWLASASSDKKVKIWSLHTGILAHEILIHPKGVTSVQYSHDGHHLVTACYDGVIRVFSSQTYSIQKQFSPDAGRMRCVAFSPDDRFIAAGADDRTIKLYDFNNGNLKRILKGHKNDVYTLGFSPDGKYLASGSLSNDLIIWSLETTEPVNSYTKFYSLVDVAFCPDGKKLAMADFNEQVKVMDVSSLHIHSSVQYERLQFTHKKGFVLHPPKISIIHPISSAKEMFQTNERSIVVKGNVQSDAGLLMLLVGGFETEVKEDGSFEKEIRIAYHENEIIVKAIDKDKKMDHDTMWVYRPFDGVTEQPTTGRKGKDYALLIATNEYDAMHHLVNPVNDMNTVAKELEERYGFITERLFNPTLSQTYSTVKKYGSKQYADDDQLLVFIAGHGEYDPIFKEGYLVATDTKKDDDARVTYLSHSNLRTLINNIPCKHIMITLDACFGGTFEQELSSRGGDIYGGVGKDEYIQRKMKYKTRLYLTSGGKEYVPDGRPGQHSPFARKFLEAMRGNGGDDGVLSFSELIGYIEKVTPEPRKGEFGDNEPGSDFLFIKKE
ncbi:MAG TPA: hypothetical protein DCR46_02050, partial [Cytophagales bacterium]|nr:hypothetical protein [Cytophagales bacterium]